MEHQLESANLASVIENGQKLPRSCKCTFATFFIIDCGFIFAYFQISCLVYDIYALNAELGSATIFYIVWSLVLNMLKFTTIMQSSVDNVNIKLGIIYAFQTAFYICLMIAWMWFYIIPRTWILILTADLVHKIIFSGVLVAFSI